MRLVFLPEAADDIDRLYDFLAEKEPIAAQKAKLAIDEGISLLMENPKLEVQMDHNTGLPAALHPVRQERVRSALPNQRSERHAGGSSGLARP